VFHIGLQRGEAGREEEREGWGGRREGKEGKVWTIYILIGV
jgi:hypothetical protein